MALGGSLGALGDVLGASRAPGACEHLRLGIRGGEGAATWSRRVAASESTDLVSKTT